MSTLPPRAAPPTRGRDIAPPTRARGASPVTRLAAFASLVVVAFGAFGASPSRADAQITYRGCFASGPTLAGAASMEFNGDVGTLTGALLATGSWQAANITSLLNGSRAAITDCVAAAKAASQPGNEFVFYFAGHGGDSFFPDAAEAGEGGGSDNHLRVGNTAAGAADRITDDELAGLLSGFRKSVTMSVILDACFSHTFNDGANDLSSVTQVNGAPVAAGAHLALSASSSPAAPKCFGGYTTKLAEGIRTGKADRNKDGTITTQEATEYAGGFASTGASRCEGNTCPAPTQEQEPLYLGVQSCDHRFEVCPTVATIPEPAAVWLVASGVLLLGGGAWRRRRPRRRAD